ncbi:TPA: hypothetical protein QDB24_000468 [Burkholderia vietnamiensis]|uniref:hypothetical protein n=1 Tax=Burkholderia cepacia complex TaxID=87882 RepID=UPI00174B7098|nr:MULTISPECIES: hypothetical protein [Burkholderia cepacia complex]MBD1410260.1 hypothetical protein [Burkholderia contaminans]MBR7908560.1 hypothetical protein [Burkholderia vietnamiensis]UXZ70040.1 hypothetical protein NUJ29_31145 [Burkholderia contaminans]UXZ76747.1 hypothetical protein NUJ30_25545 [Burkholderia contaminans]HDR9272452.1 hypothetical protein [Burkholderia vietnamiensis]
MRSSAAFLDLGYSEPATPRRSRGVDSTPVHHDQALGDRSAAATALRRMRATLDAGKGYLPSDQGVRPGDDPFARAQLTAAYERLRSALAVYNLYAADLGVPAARAYTGDVEVREAGR